MAIRLPIGTDMLVKLEGLRAQSNDTEQNGASVNMTLRDRSGASVPGQAWPTPLTSAGSGGNYTGVLVDSLSLQKSDRYDLEIIADAGANMRRTWHIPCRAVWDDEDET